MYHLAVEIFNNLFSISMPISSAYLHTVTFIRLRGEQVGIRSYTTGN